MDTINPNERIKFMNFSTPLGELHKIYGKDILVSRVKGYNIIHLDNPSDDEIKKRVREVENGEIGHDLDDNCPLCRALKDKPCDIVYYGNKGSKFRG